MKSLNQEIEAIVADCAARIARACQEVIGDATAPAAGFTAPRGRAARIARKAAKRGKGGGAKLCYFPGCKNIAAPRFGMFCAALHKNLPQRQKKQIRAQRQ